MPDKFLIKLFRLFALLLLFVFHESHGTSKYKLIENEGRVGLSDQENNIVIPAIYETIGWSGSDNLVINGLVGVKRNNFWTLYDLNKGELTSSRFVSLSPFSESLFIASKRGKLSGFSFFGLLDTKGKVVFGFQYASIEEFSDFFKVSKYKEGKTLFGILDGKEKEIIPIRFKTIDAEEIKHWKGVIGPKIYVFNSKGEKLFEVVSDSLNSAGDRHFIFYKEGQAGVIDKNGEVNISPKYKMIKWTQSGFTTLPFPEWKAFNKDKTELFTLNFDQIQAVSEKLKLIERNNNWGLIDQLGNFIIEPRYESISSIREEYFLAYEEESWSLINDLGKVLLNDFDSIRLSGKYATAKKKSTNTNEWNVYGLNGERITSKNYSSILDMSEGLFVFKKNNYWGVFDLQGREVILPKYEKIWPFESGKAIVKYHGKYGLIDKGGDFLLQPVADTLYKLNDEFYSRRRGYLSEVVDSSGEVAYNSLGLFRSHPCGILEIDEEGRFGFLNELGEVIIEPEINRYLYFEEGNMLYLSIEDQPSSLYSCDVFEYIRKDLKYQELYPFTEGFAAIKLDDRYGFIDHEKNLRIANRYDSVLAFSNGFAGVNINGKWGFIDKQERIKIQPYYESVSSFEEGRAVVSINGKYGIIGRDGEELIPIEFEEIINYSGIGYKVRKNGLYGFYAKDLGQKVNVKYKDLELLNNKWLKARRKDSFGIVDFSGLSEFPFIYEEILQDSFEPIIYFKTVPGWEPLKLNAN
ncbi:MAG: WG repeat-containing protein [Bacteroidota bacterium]